jgi:cytochrome c oxidase assembly protein subunit 15
MDRGISRSWLRRVLLANLVGQVLIVLTGGVVRLTGSGLGCPTFPQCVRGSYLPVINQPQGIHKYIEFGNRMLTPVLSVLAVAALIAVLLQVRSGGGGRRLLALGAVPVAGVFVQALIGGVIVLTGLNPALVAFHFLFSMSLIAGSTVLLLVAVPSPTESLPPPVAETEPVERAAAPARRLAVAVAIAAAIVLALGTLVTGSGPHSGDAADPNRFGFDVATVAHLHADSVGLFLALVLALIVTLRRTGGSASARRRAVVLLAVTLAQGLIGTVQYLTGVPIVLVAMHMLGAALLVVVTSAAVHAVLANPLVTPERPRLDGARPAQPAAGRTPA